jgi:hypothetical protein
MKLRAVSTIVWFILLALISLHVYYQTSDFLYACRIEDPSRYDKEITASIAILDKILDPGLTFSTTLAAFGAAALLGWKHQIKLTFISRLMIFAATIFFVQSGIYAIWFRYGASQIFSSGCPHIQVLEFFQRRVDAHLICFGLGLGSLGLLVIISLFSDLTNKTPDIKS